MDFQVKYWLFPLIFFSGLGIVLRMFMPISFAWGPMLQSAAVLAIALAGLKSPSTWIFVIVGWGLFLLIYLNSRSFYTGLQGSINALNSTKLHELSKKAKDIFWGKGGDFWRDMAEALALFIEYKEEEAEMIIFKWQQQVDSMPNELKHLPGNYRLIGNALMRKWDKIISIFENDLTGTAQAKTASILLPTARAYAESGEFEKSYQCIVNAKLDETEHPLSYVGQSILPFFALIGARVETDKLLEILERNKKTFPESLVSYWRGQSFLTSGNTEAAIRLFEDAKTKNPSKEFVERVDRQIEKARSREGEVISFHPQKEKYVRDIWRIFEQKDFVMAVIAPERKSAAVITIIVINTIIFCISDAYNFPGLKQNFEQLYISLGHNTEYVIENFALVPKLALEGQYYRFVTYLFLHLYLTHYFLNMVMLYIFGRMAENIFGTARFLAIYFIGGFLSGIPQAILRPENIAVGASGALMAAFGAVLAGVYKLKGRLPAQIWKFYMSMLIGIASAQLLLDRFAPNLIANVPLPEQLPGIADLAHLGGFLAGMIMGLLLPPVPPRAVPEIEPDPDLLTVGTSEESDQTQ